MQHLLPFARGSGGGHFPGQNAALSAPGCATFEEERTEVLESVLQAICRHAPDPDEMAACAYLVRHLSAKNV